MKNSCITPLYKSGNKENVENYRSISSLSCLNTIFEKLYNYGLWGPIYKLLKSYLSDRSKSLYINGQLSDSLPIKTGIPQGSVLGPLLFLAYVNDMPLSLDSKSIIMYADDTTLFSSHKNVNTLITELSCKLNIVDRWLKSNFLSLNINKTSYTIISYKNITEDISLSLNNQLLTRLNSFTFLGIIIDQKLTFREHVAHVCRKIAKTQGVMLRLNYLPSSILHVLYYSLIYPYLIYCVEVWGPCCPTTLYPIVIRQ